MPALNWDDPEGIALALHEKFPDLDPTYVRYTDMHQWIMELPDFDDDAKGSTEGKLEAIQMAWLEEFQDSQ
jgi:FeS assembly protein IscX